MPSLSESLIVGYLTRYNRLRTTTGTTVGRLWDRFARLDDEDDFAARAVAVSLGSQNAAVAGVLGYLTLMFTLLGEGAPEAPDLEAVTGAALRGGTPTEAVYRRGIITARTAISEGRSLAEAMGAGRARMVSTATTDVALAQRAAISETPGVVGYRRVLTGKSCALCATASTQRYKSGELMPIHNHCDCGVAPIIGDRDPGHVINKRLVTDLKQAAEASGSKDIWTNRRVTVLEDGTVELPTVEVHEHGELGPVLTQADHRWTGPSGIAA